MAYPRNPYEGVNPGKPQANGGGNPRNPLTEGIKVQGARQNAIASPPKGAKQNVIASRRRVRSNLQPSLEIASGASHPRNDILLRALRSPLGLRPRGRRLAMTSSHRGRLLRRLAPPRNDILLRAEALGASPSANGGGKSHITPYKGVEGGCEGCSEWGQRAWQTSSQRGGLALLGHTHVIACFACLGIG